MIEQRLAALAPADGIFVWTLHDFPDPDPAAVGTSPWNTRLQANFGLLDFNGTAKPAATVVTSAFDRRLADN